nr:MAG TPA: NlpE N-terminal domain [Caudoviricetes sp.]
MTNKKIDAILAEITRARAQEKQSLAEARREAELWAQEQVKEEHNRLVDAVREALLVGCTNRQIGTAYGSSDPNTTKRLITEALSSNAVGKINDHPEWRITMNDDGTFNIDAYGLGENKLSGRGKFQIDEDGENFSLIDGEMFIQVQLYKLGYKDKVITEVRNELAK